MNSNILKNDTTEQKNVHKNERSVENTQDLDFFQTTNDT